MLHLGRKLDKASETLFSLKPVSFRYTKEIDPSGTPQFGLVAEEVEKSEPRIWWHAMTKGSLILFATKR